MVTRDEAIRGAQMLTLTDGDVIAAIDAKQLRGSVGKRLPGLETVAYVTVADLEKWRAERATVYGSGQPNE
jgi:hypothetical protein